MEATDAIHIGDEPSGIIVDDEDEHEDEQVAETVHINDEAEDEPEDDDSDDIHIEAEISFNTRLHDNMEAAAAAGDIINVDSEPEDEMVAESIPVNDDDESAETVAVDPAEVCAFAKTKPALAKMTFGSIVGCCSGVANKKVGKAAAIICGFGFMTIQLAVCSSYWKKVLTVEYAKMY